jgi:hypothetical protein
VLAPFDRGQAYYSRAEPAMATRNVQLVTVSEILQIQNNPTTEAMSSSMPATLRRPEFLSEFLQRGRRWEGLHAR